MAWQFKRGARALDGVAAGVLAAAVAFAAAAVGSMALAALLAPPAFVIAYALLGLVADAPVYRLAAFELQAFDLPRPSPAAVDDDGKVVDLFERFVPTSAAAAAARDAGGAGDAGQALSAALAALRRSLR